MTADRMTYLITVANQHGAYSPERAIADMDRATTLADIANGQFEGLQSVIECNPVEGICHDVTEDIAREVMSIWAVDGEPIQGWQREFIEAHVGVRAANSFLQAAE